MYIYTYNLHLYISLVGGLLWNDRRAMGGQAGGGWVDCRQARGGWVRDGCRGIMKGVSIKGYGVIFIRDLNMGKFQTAITCHHLP